MKKFRLGRVDEPWTNLEPPIRRADFYTNLERQESEKKHPVVPERPSKRAKSVDLGSVRVLHSRCLVHSHVLIPAWD